jgi:chaperone protein DnaJ
MTEEQRELLRQFASLRGESLTEGSQVKHRGGLFSRLKDQFK